MGSYTCTAEDLRKACVLLKVMNLRKDEFACSTGDHTKLDSSILLGKYHHQLYQKLVGMVDRMVQIGRFDIHYEFTSLNRISESPSERYTKRLVRIFGYLQHDIGSQKSIIIFPEDIRDISGKGGITI